MNFCGKKEKYSGVIRLLCVERLLTVFVLIIYYAEKTEKNEAVLRGTLALCEV